MFAKKLSKWVAMMAAVLLSAVGARAQYLPINDYVSGQNTTNHMHVWGAFFLHNGSGPFIDPLPPWLQVTGPGLGPTNGVVAFVTNEAPVYTLENLGGATPYYIDDEAPNNFLDTYPGQQPSANTNLPLWGTYYTYFPTNQHWYGIDSFTVSPSPLFVLSPNLIVTNIMDRPVATANAVFVGDVNHCANVMKTGSVAIVAFDWDNLPLTNDLKSGLTYKFTSGAYTQNTTLGLATLTNNQLYIDVTNAPPLPQMTNITITVQVRDESVRPLMYGNGTVYTNDSGANNTNDFTNLVVNVYYIYRNNLFAGGQSKTQDVLAYGYADLTNSPPTALTDWTIGTPPAAGMVTLTNLVPVDGNILNNWPYYGTQTWWGTHFTYTPTNANWWGLDSMSVSNANGDIYSISIAVTNLTDEPDVEQPCDLFVSRSICSGFTNGSLVILATDKDNVYTNASHGLLYTFTNDATVWSNELGEATLAGSNLTFVVTNMAAPLTLTAVQLPIRVRDIAQRTYDWGCTNYPDATGTNDTADKTDITVDVYYLYTNPFFVGGEDTNQTILAWSNAPTCSFPGGADLLHSWSILNAPSHGDMNTVTNTSAADFDSYESWSIGTLATIQLPQGVSTIQAVQGAAELYDQGSGFESDDNGLYVQLLLNNTQIGWFHALGTAGHGSHAVRTFNLGAAALGQMNDALAAINWSTNPVVTLNYVAAPIGYPAWALHARQAAISLTYSGDPSYTAYTVAPDAGNPTNNWPYYGTQTWWGTYFNYTPSNNWYGVDQVTVQNNGYTYDIPICVTNITDKPEASACDIYVRKTDCAFTSSETTPILATDLDNLYTNASYGLVYAFAGATNNELGFAALDGSNLTFTVTNAAARPTPVPYVITVRVTDTASRSNLEFGCTNYPDATGANDPADWTDISVNVYNLYGNPAFAAGEGDDQTNILAWFYLPACSLSNLVPLNEWTIFNGPYNGYLTTNLVVTAAGLNGTNNWPYYGTQTWWGTHFTYRPANTNWYGLDTVTVTTASEQMYDITIAVTNTTDKPVVSACDLFVYPSNCVGFTAASTVITATDRDNLDNSAYGLVYEFADGSTVWSNELGTATLSGSNLSFVVTNLAAPFTPAPYILPVVVRDYALRPSISNSCVIYPDATGTNDLANDFEAIDVPLYNFLVPSTNVAAQNVAQQLLAWSNAPMCAYVTNGLLYNWTIVSGPANGSIIFTNVMAPDAADATNNWPHYGTQTWWGTHFTYRPSTNWYGQDAITVKSGQNGEYTNVLQIVVTNLMDVPVAFDTNLALMVCNGACGSATSSVTLLAVDVDNLPVSGLGLVYTFGDGSFTTNAELGVATLTNNILYFAKTNLSSVAMTNVIGVRIHDYSNRVTASYGCLTFPDVSGTNAVLTNDYKDILVTVNFTTKQAPVLVAQEPVKFHPVGETPYDIYEGEAVHFTAQAWDYATNNSASASLSDCMWGITGITWNVYATTNLVPNLLYTETKLPTTLPVVQSNGVSTLLSDFNLDTSSDRWFVERLPLRHTYTAIVEVIAYDVCGNPSMTNWAIVVRPTLETPVITFQAPTNIVLGARGRLCAWDHNSNDVFFVQVAGPGGIAIDGNGGTNCVGFTATNSGSVTVKTTVLRDNQAMAGDPLHTFEVLIGTNIFAPKVLDITGIDTNESSYGEIVFNGPASSPSNAWPAGTVISISAVPTALGLTNKGGYTFTRWEIPSNAFTTALNVYDRSQSSTINLALPSGLTTNAIGGLRIIAIFKRTAELAVPVVNGPVEVVTNALPCAKVGKSYGPYIFTNTPSEMGNAFTVQVQSEDLPGLEAVGLPTGMVFSATIGASNYPGGGVSDTDINYTTFTNLTLSGIPTNVGLFEVTVYATNAHWHAGWRDNVASNDVLRAPGNLETNRDVVFHFTINVVSQELANVVSSSPVLTNALALAKITKPYTQSLLGTRPLEIESDSTNLTLQLTGLESTGLSFSYVNLGRTTTNGQLGCYLETYAFDNLVISGTPTNSGTNFVLTLYAVNATGTQMVESVSLTILPLLGPVVERAPLFLAPIARVDRAYDYMLGSCDQPVCRELLIWSECEPLNIYATNLPAGLSLSVTTEDAYDTGSSYDPNNWSNAFYYTCVRIYGTPTAPGTNHVVLVASNCAGMTNIVWDDIVVKPHEVQAPVWTNIVVTAGKQNCAYSYDFTSLLQPVTVKSDLPATLRIDGLPAGISFTFGGGQTALGSAATEYLDTYQFSGLKIQGTAPVANTYTGTLVAVSSATQSTITVFTLVIRPQTLPVFKNPAIFAEALTKARLQWGYDFTFANDLVVYSDNGLPTITVNGLPDGLTNSLVGADGSAANGYGTDYTYGRLRISGTPVNNAYVGTNVIQVVASNTVGASTQTFSLVVMPQTTVVDAKTFTTVLPDAKSNWVYTASLPDVAALKSDSAATLVLTQPLPAGLSFTYAVQKTSDGSVANDYRDTYTFNTLKIAGTPMQAGVFTNSLYATNAAGMVLLSGNFTLTVVAQDKPAFQNPEAFNDAVAKARINWAYSFEFSRDIVLFSDDTTAPTLTVNSLPTGLTAAPLLAADPTVSGYGKVYTFGKLKISGTPTSTSDVRTNTISVVAQNANGVTTQRFSLVVMPQTTVVDAKTFTTVLPDAKSNWVYTASLSDVAALKSDSAATLVLLPSNNLPAGLSFTYAVQKTSADSVANDYRDTYTFNALKIAGTPTQTGVFTNTLVARNAAGDVELSTNFTLTVVAQDKPLFQNPEAFNDTVGKARINWAYSFEFSRDIVLFSDDTTAPTLTVNGLPTGLTAAPLVAAANATASGYGKIYTFGKVKISGTPAAGVGTNTISVVAQNATGVTTQRFSLVVMPQTTVVEAKTFPTTLAGAKSNWVYEASLPDVAALKSDTAVTLVLLPSNNLPAGLSFTYAVQKTSADSVANDYRDTYTFNALKIEGTPTQVGVFTNTLVARNLAGDVVLSANFTLTVAAQVVPVFKNPAIFNQAITTARAQRFYDFTMDTSMIVYSDEGVKPVISVSGLPTGLTWDLTADDSASEAVGAYGFNYTLGKLRIHGTPVSATNATVVVTAHNAAGDATKSFALQVLAQGLALVPSFVTVAPNAKVTKAYSLAFPDVEAYSDSAVTLQVTNLPGGLTFAYDAGVTLTNGTAEVGYRDIYRFSNLRITGTPTNVVTNTCGLVAINDKGTAVISTFTLVVTPLTKPEFVSMPWTTQPLTTGRVGRLYSYAFPGALVINSDNSEPVLTVAGLPPGLQFNFSDYAITAATYGNRYTYSGLTIGGTPETNGTFKVDFIARNDLGVTTNSIMLVVKPHSSPILVPPVTAPTLPHGKITKPYSYTFPTDHPVIVKSDIPVTLSMSNLPAGLTFSYVRDVSVGNAFTDNLDTYIFTNLKIEGTPMTAGASNLILMAKNGVLPDALVYTCLLIIDPATVTAVPSGFASPGTFDGWATSGSYKGAASMSVVVKPGITNFYGSFKIANQGYSFEGTASALTQSVDGVWMVNTSILVGADRVPLCLQIAGDHVFAIDGVEEKAVTLDLFRNRWSEAAVPANLVGYYTMAMPSLDGVAGSGYLTLTVSSGGSVKAGGKLGDGTAVSLSATLIAAGGNNAAPYLVVVNPPVPRTYNAGFVFGVAEFVTNSCLRLFQGVMGTNEASSIMAPSDDIVWVNNNPMATAHYNDASTYGSFTEYRDGTNHGFVRAIGVSGGRYSSTKLLENYYVGDIGAVADKAVGNNVYAQSSDFGSVGLKISTNKTSKNAYVAPRADTPRLVGNAYDYGYNSNNDSFTNAAGLTITMNKVTGIYGGAFKIFFDAVVGENIQTGKQTIKHTSTTVNYVGVMLPVRADMEDGKAGRGFFLLADTSTYEVNYTRKGTNLAVYKFNWSYDFYLSDQLDF
jgi:hypothetical protein